MKETFYHGSSHITSSMDRLLSTLSALTLGISACSGTQEEALQQPENQCEASIQRFTNTLDTLERKVTRAEDLQRKSITRTIETETGLIKNSIRKTIGVLDEQYLTMQNSCPEQKPTSHDIVGAPEFSIRLASLKKRLEKLGLND